MNNNAVAKKLVSNSIKSATEFAHDRLRDQLMDNDKAEFVITPVLFAAELIINAKQMLFEEYPVHLIEADVGENDIICSREMMAKLEFLINSDALLGAIDKIKVFQTVFKTSKSKRSLPPR